MTTFLAGMEASGFLVAALLLLRFWRKTGDMLFVWFAGAFCLFALNQFLLTLLGEGAEEGGAAFMPRLLGFALLAAAIVAKNL
jgi:hypothetical protein